MVGGAAAAVAVGVTAGVVLFRTPQGDARDVRAGEVAFADAGGRVEVEELATLRREAASAKDLRATLAKSEARVAELERRLGAIEKAGGGGATASAGGSKKPAAGGSAGADGQAGAGEGAGSPEDEKEKRIAELIKKVDWKAGAKAIVGYFKGQRAGKPLEPDAMVTLSQLNTDVMALSKALDLDNPFGAYGDPRVKALFLPAWYSAMGADMDDAQMAQFMATAEQHKSAYSGEIDEKTLAGQTLDATRQKIQEEETLFQILRPEQQARYLETVGDDPYFAMHMQEKQFEMSSPEGLVNRVAGAWTETFQLSDAAQEAARRVADRYVQAAVQTPRPDPALDPAARRRATLQRAQRLLELQMQAERELAADPALSADERTRAAAGAGYALDVALSQ
jgi:hypothetical protein